METAMIIDLVCLGLAAIACAMSIISFYIRNNSMSDEADRVAYKIVRVAFYLSLVALSGAWGLGDFIAGFF